MLDLITNPWFALFVGGFASNGIITQVAALTPTKKDDAAVNTLSVILKTITGTHGLSK